MPFGCGVVGDHVLRVPSTPKTSGGGRGWTVGPKRRRLRRFLREVVPSSTAPDKAVQVHALFVCSYEAELYTIIFLIPLPDCIVGVVCSRRTRHVSDVKFRSRLAVILKTWC